MIPQEGRFILKFSAKWCSPCKTLTNILNNSTLTLPIIDIDIDENPEQAQQYNVRGVPTMILIDNNTEVVRKVGVTSQQVIYDTFK